MPCRKEAGCAKRRVRKGITLQRKGFGSKEPKNEEPRIDRIKGDRIKAVEGCKSQGLLYQPEVGIEYIKDFQFIEES